MKEACPKNLSAAYDLRDLYAAAEVPSDQTYKIEQEAEKYNITLSTQNVPTPSTLG